MAPAGLVLEVLRCHCQWTISNVACLACHRLTRPTTRFPLASCAPCDDSVPLLPFPRSLFAPLHCAQVTLCRFNQSSQQSLSGLACLSQHRLATSLAVAHPPFSVARAFVLLLVCSLHRPTAQAGVSSLQLHRNLSLPLSHFPSSSHIRHPPSFLRLVHFPTRPAYSCSLLSSPLLCCITHHY